MQVTPSELTWFNGQHNVEPTVCVCLPALHCVQLVLPAVSENVFAVQFRQ
jgi:hypothetical protein